MEDNLNNVRANIKDDVGFNIWDLVQAEILNVIEVKTEDDLGWVDWHRVRHNVWANVKANVKANIAFNVKRFAEKEL